MVPSREAGHGGCYVGPALFEPGARVYATADTETVWGTVTDGSELLVRSCGDGDRVEIVRALGRDGPFGWVEATELARLGAVDCTEGLRFVQDPSSWRIFVGGPDPGPFAPHDEILRIGDHRVEALIGEIPRVRLDTVCDDWLRGRRFTVSRDGERVERFEPR